MKGGLYLFALVAAISMLGLHEFYKLAERKGAYPQIGVGMVFGLFVVSVFAGKLLPLSLLEYRLQVFVFVCLFFIPLITATELFRKKGSAVLNVATTVFGVCYVPLFLGSLVGVRELFNGEGFHIGRYFTSPAEPIADVVQRVYGWGGATIITLFVSIWMCDSLAYFAGRTFGKHKLFERVSPKKTWEGAIAGYVGAVAAFLISQNYFLPFMSVGDAFMCGSIIGIFGQLGDLVESLLKRDAGVKDSSTLIPGHGGALDRFDSLIFVSPLVYLYLRFVVF